jgi:hypothetical protein
MPKTTCEERKKFISVKISDLEYELLIRVSRAMHLNRSECIRLLIWQKYDELISKNYHPETGILDTIPQEISELQEVQNVSI